MQDLLTCAGRLNRLAYFMRTLWTLALMCLFLTVVSLAASLLPKAYQLWLAIPLLGVAALSALVSLMRLSARRLHDLNVTGKLALLMLIPGVNVVMVLLLMLVPGQPVTNRFGAPPMVATPIEVVPSQPASES